MFKFCNPLPLALTAAAMWLPGCVEADEAGAPTLLAFELVGPDGAPVANEGMVPVPTVSPRVSLNALFDNIIDYTLVQDADAGVGKPGVVVVTAPNNPMVSSNYTPNGHHKFTLLYPKGPTITAQISPGLPSGAPVRAVLDVTKIRGKGGQPLALGPSVTPTLDFITAPFAVTGETPPEEGGAFAADHAFKITASNLTSEAFATKVAVSGTLAMMPIAGLEAEVTVDEADPTSFLVSPKAGSWPAGATITVTVAADAADAFGVALGAPAVLTFPVAAAAAMAP